MLQLYFANSDWMTGDTPFQWGGWEWIVRPILCQISKKRGFLMDWVFAFCRMEMESELFGAILRPANAVSEGGGREGVGFGTFSQPSLSLRALWKSRKKISYFGMAKATRNLSSLELRALKRPLTLELLDPPRWSAGLMNFSQSFYAPFNFFASNVLPILEFKK